MRIIRTIEHNKLDNHTIESINNFALDFSCEIGEIKFLKLNSSFETSYFIGADWLVEKELALIVEPKINNLDYLKMFMECFNSNVFFKDLSRIYKIHFEKKEIEINTNKIEITPLIVIHFLNTINNIVKRGLKQDYIRVESNLQSKVKGKILFNRSLKINNFKGRTDRNFCNFQEYSIDCIENQILKKALNFVSTYLKLYFRNEKKMLNTLNLCVSAFSGISDEIEITKIKQFKINPLFMEYSEALRLAKLIFQRFSYSISEVNRVSDYKIPPFYIDMSLLFEIYVFSKLYNEYGNSILYQSKGRYGNTDFLKIDDKIIIDAKYSTKYKIDYVIENIRQLSGYSRDIGILKKLKIDGDNTVVDCLIIYPNDECEEDFANRSLREEQINQFIKFYKCGIKLPIKKSS